MATGSWVTVPTAFPSSPSLDDAPGAMSSDATEPVPTEPPPGGNAAPATPEDAGDGRLPRLTRRSAMACCAAALVGARRAPPPGASALSDLERRRGGRLGVFALDVGTGRDLHHRADERFKLYSTFKGLLAALVLADVARGVESLDARVRYGREDLLPASPITSAHVQDGALTVVELCEAIMHRSDNAAANLLMARRGGPERLTAYLRSLGDGVTRIDSYEGQLEGRPASFDTSTPRAIVRTLRHLLLDGGLPGDAARRLEAWMQGNVVGRSRLRAAFPGGWTAGDRTGTGDGWCNDFAIARRSGAGPLIVGAYYNAPGMELERQEEVLRDVGRIVVDWQRGS